MVFVDNHGASPHISNVGIEDRLGGYLAGRHLIEAGHRRIGFVGPTFDKPGVIRERHAGFMQALTESGLSLRREHVVRCDAGFDAAIAAAQQVLAAPQRPTAIFATADIIAAGLLKGFLRAGVAVPDQMSLIGFDDLEVSRYVTPRSPPCTRTSPARPRRRWRSCSPNSRPGPRCAPSVGCSGHPGRARIGRAAPLDVLSPPRAARAARGGPSQLFLSSLASGTLPLNQ
jgi:hypothetical protein